MVGTEQSNESWHVWMVPDSYILHRLPALPFDEHTRHAIGFQGYLGMVCLLYPCPTSGPSTRSAPDLSHCAESPSGFPDSKVPRLCACACA